jgi:hypothetical protein
VAQPVRQSDFGRVVIEARRAQIAQDTAAVRDLERLLAGTASELRRAILQTPRGILAGRYRRELLANLDRGLEQFRVEYKDMLDSGIMEAAGLAEQREKDILNLFLKTQPPVGTDPSLLMPFGNRITAQVSFGNFKQTVLERLYARTYKDGIKLSQRLYNMDQAGRKAIADLVAKSIVTGQSARSLARDIEPLITREGVDNVRYKAMRIARTEINTAYREGHIASITDSAGRLPSYISAIGWRLSASHPRPCYCDVLASDDSDGLGPGNYLPENVPTGSHPHCLCFTVSVMEMFPEDQWTSKVPRPEEVPESELKYYGLEMAA